MRRTVSEQPNPFRNSPMMLPWDSIPDQGGNFFQQVGRGVKNFICGLHQKSPSALTNDCKVLFTPPCKLAHAYWDRVCGGNQGTIKRTRIFGGQCNILYTIRYEKALIQNGTFQNWFGPFTTGQVQGPIQSFTITVGGVEVPDPYVGHWQFRGQYIETGPFNGGGYKFFANGELAASLGGSGNRLVGFDPIGNEEDNCGDGPESLEYENDRPLEEGDTSTNLPVTLNDGTTLNFDLTLVSINVDVEFNLGLELGDKDNPGGGLGITADVNGVTFDPNGTGGPAPNDVGGGDNCKPKKPSFPDLQEEDGQEEEDDEELEYVKITLTKFPDRISFGKDVNTHNFFAGFFKWKVGDEGYTVPQYIMSKENIYEAPENAKGYAVSFRYGAEGIIKKLKLSTEAST